MIPLASSVLVVFMHCVRLAELASIVSQHGPAFIASRSAIPASSVSCYWTASRNRFDLWHQAIGRYHIAQRQGNWSLMQQWWRRHFTVLEEILVGEMLTRVVAAVAAGLESKTHRDEVSPVTEAVFLSHLDASNRVHDLMLKGRGNTVQDAVRLNRLRTGVERWTDAILGRVSLHQNDCIRFAMDRNRASIFAEEARTMGSGPGREMASWLMNASMRDVLARRTSEQPALGQANRNVAESVMLLFQPEWFDDFGFLKSLNLQRLSNGNSDDRQLVVEASREFVGFHEGVNAKAEDGPESDPGDGVGVERWYQ